MSLPKILIVDDVEDNHLVIRHILNDLDVEVIDADSGAEALERLKENTFFLILLDVQMPGMDGYETAAAIYKQPEYANLPVIFVTGMGRAKENVFKGYESGAVDYLLKPLEPDIVSSKVAVFLKLYLQQLKLIETQEDLKRSNAELDAFAYAASHDLRSPLRGISNLASFLEEDAADVLTDDCKQHIVEIRNRIEYMNDLMDTLLQYASIGHGDIVKEMVGIDYCVNRALVMLEVEIKEKNVIVNKEGEFPKIEIKPAWITQLYQNLISNAVKFVADKTPEITLTAHADEKEGWIFGVHDNGIGIEEKNFSIVFEPFRFLNHKKIYSGSGIGLSTCSKIVLRHKGRLWVESKGLGQGSSFYFTLNEALDS